MYSLPKLNESLACALCLFRGLDFYSQQPGVLLQLDLFQVLENIHTVQNITYLSFPSMDLNFCPEFPVSINLSSFQAPRPENQKLLPFLFSLIHYT